MIPDDAHRRARSEHAFMLRCEGLSYDEIGARIPTTDPYYTGVAKGVSKERARQLVCECARNLGRAMRHTKVHYE